MPSIVRITTIFWMASIYWKKMEMSGGKRVEENESWAALWAYIALKQTHGKAYKDEN